MTRAITQFQCEGERLIGIVDGAESVSDVGVLIVVGGPQYRVGSHRQFVLLARDLASEDIPTMRFDYRGMGDASGQRRTFETIAADIAAAASEFRRVCPQIQRIVLWGLCDGASASLFHAANDPQISGVVMLNPWVRTETGHSKALFSHYYSQRILSGQFWRHLMSGKVSPLRSAQEMLKHFWKARGDDAAPSPGPGVRSVETPPLPQRLARAWKAFKGPTLLVLAGQDLVATEFKNAAYREPLSNALEKSQVTVVEIAEATHTFSSRSWRDNVTSETLRFVKSLKGNAQNADIYRVSAEDPPHIPDLKVWLAQNLQMSPLEVGDFIDEFTLHERATLVRALQAAYIKGSAGALLRDRPIV